MARRHPLRPLRLPRLDLADAAVGVDVTELGRRLRRFCRRPMRSLLISPIALVAFSGPLLMDACNPPIELRGNTFVSAYCEPTGGMYFTNVLTGFPGRTKFHYHVVITFNGLTIHNY